MKKVAWVSHYTRESDIFLINNFYSQHEIINRIFKSINANCPPYVFSNFINCGKKIEYFGIIYPKLPHALASMSKTKQLDVIKKATKLCNKLKIDQIGIGALFASIWENTEELSDFTSIPITTGKNLIGSLVIDYVTKAYHILQKAISNDTLGVIGYKTKLAKVMVNYYKDKFKKILVDEYDDEIKKHNNIYKESVPNIFKASDAIISNSMGLGVDSYINLIKPGSIACDMMAPFYLTTEIHKKRNDVLAFEGVWSKYQELVGYENKKGKIDKMLPHGVVPACVAEPLILALEDKSCSFSSYNNISCDNIGLIEKWRIKNGFIFFGFKQGYHIYSDKDLYRIKNAVKK